MTCDTCKTTIAKGEPYAITEFGRTHSRCLRGLASGQVNGPLRPILDTAGNPYRLVRDAPVYVLRRQ